MTDHKRDGDLSDPAWAETQSAVGRPGCEGLVQDMPMGTVGSPGSEQTAHGRGGDSMRDTATGVRCLPIIAWRGHRYIVDFRLSKFRTLVQPPASIRFVRFGSSQGQLMPEELGLTGRIVRDHEG